ncbi:9586_t:CDS:2 [Funneliformis geosporum]|nr:9586_t:CDS:2 [Funneliformis geosporum]
MRLKGKFVFIGGRIVEENHEFCSIEEEYILNEVEGKAAELIMMGNHNFSDHSATSEELFLPFKILFLLDTKIEETFFGSGSGGDGGVIGILESQLWKNGRYIVKISTRRRRLCSNSSLL